MKPFFCGLLLLGLASFAGGPASAADDPAAVIRATVDRALEILRDPELRRPERRPDRIAKLRAVADQVFRWDVMAQSSLGVTYRRITDPERKEFVALFEDLIADDYMDDLDRFMGDESVTVQGVEVRDDQRVVKTLLVTHSRERVPIDYFMHREADKWVVHDFSVEGVSLVNHYRKSFSDFLVNHAFEELLDRLRARHPH
jgi:phospholipid transport system substrate-binding protein